MPQQATETLDVNGRRVLDVSGLPDKAMDSHAPVWWGNLLLILIESTTVVLLLVSYFYLRRNFDAWPPTQPNWVPPLFNPVPNLPIPTVELILMVLSCGLMYWTDMAARRQDAPKVKIGLWVMVAIAAALTAMRFMEMQPEHLKFRWDENAYGSIIWVILGTHLTYLLGALAEFFIIAVWMLRHGFDPKHGLDITLMGGYWYWASGTWVLCYLTVYVGARVL